MTQDPCEPIVIQADDGGQLSAYLHGGHITGWCPPGGSELLWMSQDAVCEPGKALRGGIPVIWPQFSDRGDLPRHGLARNRAWTLVRAGPSDNGAAEVALSLTDDEATRAIWPQRFSLTLEAQARGNRLEVSLRVENPGPTSWSFTVALHTYLRITGDATVEGLGGHTAEDHADNRALKTVPEGELTFSGPEQDGVDWAVRDVDGLVTAEDGNGRRVVEATGFADRVWWNPGPGKAPKDVHAGGEAEFVCIEPAVLTPVTLAPSETWVGTQSITYTPSL